MSDLLPPLNAVELYDFCEESSRSHADGIRLFVACGYEHLGSYPDGGEYYAPIAGRMPATWALAPTRATVTSPTSFREVYINADAPVDLRAFLDAEGAYLPVKLEEI